MLLAGAISGLLLFASHIVLSISSPVVTELSKPWPTSYAALGDSYAAGAGAGKPITFSCGRFAKAYPILLAHNTSLNIPEWNFRNLACGGSDSRGVMSHQVPLIGKSDVVTITVGGNEIHFFHVLNACIYNWLPSSSCEVEMNVARALIESQGLVTSIDAMIAAAMARLHSDAVLLVTGYARFFNDSTDLCDRVTFSRRTPLDFLTKQKRRALNQLVSLLNEVVRASAAVHGATYIDIDRLFEGHRFCEKDVQEPDINREETWFFNLPASDFGVEPPEPGTTVNQGEVPDTEGVHVGFGQNTPCLSEQNRLQGGEHGDHGGCFMSSSFPDIKTARTFHPTIRGHEGIANAIVKEVLGHRLKALHVARM